MKIALALLLSFSFVAHADECNKIEQKKTDSFVEEYPLDDNVMKLSAYRTGLCHYIKLNKLTQDRANELFESERNKIMNEKLSRNQKPTA
jgi:hypothetical protein